MHFIYLTMTYIPMLGGGPSPKGMCLFNQLQQFFRVQQGWTEQPHVSSDNTQLQQLQKRVVEQPSSSRQAKEPAAQSDQNPLLQRPLGWMNTEPAHAMALARSFTSLCKGLCPAETEAKIGFEEEDETRRSLWGSEQPYLLSPRSP